MTRIGRNVDFPIYKGDGTPFNDLVLKKSTVDIQTMSLNDSISGDVYYKDNTLGVNMQEYIVYNGTKYLLVNPPVIVKEGMLKDNSDLKGMTKYTFTFYHPMYMLNNFPFCDIAVTDDEEKYLSQNKTFSWIGKIADFIAKLNANLRGTQWLVAMSRTLANDEAKLAQMSDVLTFDQVFVGEALKKCYETWQEPFAVSEIIGEGFYTYEDEHDETHDYYTEGKRFVITFGSPAEEIYDCDVAIETASEAHGNNSYYSPHLLHLKANKTLFFKNVEGVEEGGRNFYIYDTNFNSLVFDLQTMSYTPSVDKDVYLGCNTEGATIVAYYNYNTNSDEPFVFRFGQGLGLKNNSRSPKNNKIVTRIFGYGSEDNIPYGYPQIRWWGNPDWDYTINNSPTAAYSYPIYDGIVGGVPVRLIKHPFTRTTLMPPIYSETVFNKVSPYLPREGSALVPNPDYDPDAPIVDYYDAVDDENHVFPNPVVEGNESSEIHQFEDIKPELDPTRTIGIVSAVPLNADLTPASSWDDTMDDEGNYVQSYFRITLPILSFDLYASAAITQEMSVNMRSGACVGCTFPVQIDWEDYKLNFWKDDGQGNLVFDPVIHTTPNDGHVRDGSKYPDSREEQIDVILQKETSTFGTLMPNVYQNPHSGDVVVFLGISLPAEYISDAEERLREASLAYMLENNIYYYEYPLKFDEHFLATHQSILAQVKPNTVIRFQYANTTLALYVKQISIKYGQAALPQYDITLTDEVTPIVNAITQVQDGVANINTELSNLQLWYNRNFGTGLIEAINTKLSRSTNDVAQGIITFLQGLKIGSSGTFGIDKNGTSRLFEVLASSLMQSDNFVSSDFVEGDEYTGGTGFQIKETNEGSKAEVDDLVVRRKASFTELELRKLSAVYGNIFLSNASSVIEHVVVTSTSNYTQYKCYIKTDDGTMATTNAWVAGDIVRCQTFNVDENATQYGLSNKHYAFNLHSTGTDDLGTYLVLRTNLMWSGSLGAPEEGDTIVQTGSFSNNSRRNLIVLETSGAEPIICLYKGVAAYDMSAYIVAKIAPSGTIFRTTNFKVTSDFNTTPEQIAIDRGEYNPTSDPDGMQCNYYDRVSYQGSLWLCINPAGNYDGSSYVAPSVDATDYWLQQVAKGDTGATTTVAMQMTPNAIVVPAATGGVIDPAFTATAKLVVTSGDQDITSQYQIVNVSTTGCNYTNNGNGTVTFHTFTAAGEATVHANIINGGTATLISSKIIFSVVVGGSDAYVVDADQSYFISKVAQDGDRPQSAMIYMYATKGSTYITGDSSVTWSVVSTSHCTAVTMTGTLNNKKRISVSQFTDDYATVTVQAVIGGITFLRTIQFQVVRDGTVVAMDGTTGEWILNGEGSGTYPSSYSSELDRYNVTMPVDYNSRQGRVVIKPHLFWGGSEIALVAANVSVVAPQGVTAEVGLDALNQAIVTITSYTPPTLNTTVGGTLAITITHSQHGSFSQTHYVNFDIATVEMESTGSEWAVVGYARDAGDNIRKTKAQFKIGFNQESQKWEARLKSDNISLEGHTTINGDVHINEDGTLYGRNARFENCVLEGYLRTGVSANWQETAVGQRNIVVVGKPDSQGIAKMNFMLPNLQNSDVYLPCDPEFIGARVVLVAPSGIKNTNGEIPNTTSHPYLANIYAGRAFVNHSYKRNGSYDDDVTVEGIVNLFFDQGVDGTNQTIKSPFNASAGASFWFAGARAYISGSPSTWCPDTIQIQNGCIELLGIPGPELNNFYYASNKYNIMDNGALAISGGWPVATGEADPLHGQAVSCLCQWAIVNVQADYVNYLRSTT